MRFRHVVALAAAALAAAAAAGGAAGASYSNLQPGPAHRRPEGAGPGQRRVHRSRAWASAEVGVPLGPPAVQADRPLPALLRGSSGARDRLPLRRRGHLHERVLGERASSPRSQGSPRRPTGPCSKRLQRAGRHPRRRPEPFHRRTERREVADRPRAARREHAREHDLLRELVGRSDFIDHVYTKIGEPTRTPGTTSASEPRAARSSRGAEPRPMTRRPASARAASAASGSSTSPPAPSLGRELRHHQCRPRRGRRARLPHSGRLGVRGRRLPVAGALAGDLSLVARYAAINLLFTSSPLYPPYPRQSSCRSRSTSTQHVRGLGGRGRERWRTRSPTTSSRSRASCSRHCSSDTQDLKFRGEGEGVLRAWLDDEAVLPETSPSTRVRELVPLPRAEHRGLLDQEPQRSGQKRLYEAPAFNYATTRTSPPALFLGYADDNYVDGTQSFVFTGSPRASSSPATA